MKDFKESMMIVCLILLMFALELWIHNLIQQRNVTAHMETVITEQQAAVKLLEAKGGTCPPKK